MPGKTKYNLVDDGHDLRIPLHNEEAFQHGINFEAKVNSGTVRGVNPSLRLPTLSAPRQTRAFTKGVHLCKLLHSIHKSEANEDFFFFNSGAGSNVTSYFARF